jgi:hypothetical protein
MEHILQYFSRDALKFSKHEAALRLKSPQNFVKVAVIDSGVCPAAEDLQTVEIVGESFVDDRIKSGDTHWHSPLSAHGTVVAALISKMNPYCKIYAAKIKSGGSRADVDVKAAIEVCPPSPPFSRSIRMDAA